MTRAFFAVLGTVVGLVLLLTFKTHPATSTASPVSAPIPTTAPSSPAASPSSSPSSSRSSGTTSAGQRTIAGNVVDTRYGPVQVQVTMSSGRITKVTVLQSPTAMPADVQIGQYAIPQLDRETISAQSAGIDAVSGATYTSDGYIQSLQSALDKARA
jgi:uncharacterized protein with FMN-binding domain